MDQDRFVEEWNKRAGPIRQPTLLDRILVNSLILAAFACGVIFGKLI